MTSPVYARLCLQTLRSQWSLSRNSCELLPTTPVFQFTLGWSTSAEPTGVFCHLAITLLYTTTDESIGLTLHRC